MLERLSAKEMITQKNGKKLISSIADGSVQLSGRDPVLRTPTLIREQFELGEEREVHWGESDGSQASDSFHPERRIIPKFHYDTLTWLGLHIQPWMFCRNAVLTIVGTFMRIEICQMHGLDSHSSPYWMKNLLTDTPAAGWVWRRCKLHQGQITYGQKCGQWCQKQLNVKKSKDGQWKNRSSTTQESWEASTLSILKMLNSKKPFKTNGRSWKCHWKQPCLIRSGTARTRKPDQSMLVSWKPKYPQESELKEFNTEIKKITLQEKDSVHWVSTIMCSSSSLCLKRWKFWMRKPRWTRNGRSSKNCQHSNWRKSGAKKRWFKRHREKEEQSILQHWWTLVISKILSWDHNFKNAKAVWCFEVRLWRPIRAHLQYSQSVIRLHHKWRPQKYWMWYHG